MSTISPAIFSVSEHPVIPESPASGLCMSVSPSGIVPVCAFKDLPERQMTISVRAFDPASDTPILFKWMSQEYAGPLMERAFAPQALEESYTCMIESDFAQPFMGMVNNVPVCQVDVYKTRQDVISLYYDARPGDYGLHLVIAPLAIQDNIAILVRTCIEYFFSFPEVGRIVADIEIRNEWNHELFKKAGFRAYKKIRTAYKSSNLMICTRNSLRRAGLFLMAP
jgi:hypothetical protein